jgi:biotin carboxylase
MGISPRLATKIFWKCIIDMIGHRGQYTPVGAYLAGDEIIKIAQEHGVHLIHPGAETLSPRASMVSAVGPTKTIPAFSTFRAKSAFSAT